MLSYLWNAVQALARSGKWPAVRKKHLAVQPVCQCCGRDKELEVHHIHPVHAGGDELDPTNLITFCRDCHFVVGHACDWHAWRNDVRHIAMILRGSDVRRVDGGS